MKRLSVILAFALVISLVAGVGSFASAATTEPDFLFTLPEGVSLADENAAAVHDGLLRVTNGEKVGFVDLNGATAIDFSFDAADDFSGGYAAASVEDLWGFIDTTGAWVVEPVYVSEAGQLVFSEGFAAVPVDGSWSYIKEDGSIAFSGFDSAEAFINGYAKVTAAGAATLIGTDGKAIFDGFEDVDYHGEFPVAISDGGLWGFADKSGKVVIEAQFDSACGFNSGVAAVVAGDKCGYITSSGKFVFERAASGFELGNFNGGVAFVSRKSPAGFAYVDASGSFVIPFDSFDDTTGCAENLISMQLTNFMGTKCGAVDYDGSFVIPFVYSSLGVSSEGYLVAKKYDAEADAYTVGVIANPLYISADVTFDTYIPGDKTIFNDDGSITYIVKKGDTFNTIAVNYYGSIAKASVVKEANGGSEVLLIASEIKLPQAGLLAPLTSDNNAEVYVVAKGDTLASIAARYDVSVSALASANADRVPNANILYIGQVLLIP